MVLVLTRGLPSSTCGHEFLFRSSWTIPKFFPRPPSQLRLTLRAILDCLQAPQIAKDILSRKKSCYLGDLDPEKPQKIHRNWGKMSILLA